MADNPVSGRTQYESALRRATIGVCLASRAIEKMPRGTLDERMEKANAMMAALRVTKMGAWRPTFPFASSRERAV